MDLADLWLIVRLTYTSANVLLTGVIHDAVWKQFPTSCTRNVDSIPVSENWVTYYIWSMKVMHLEDLRYSESECGTRAYRDGYVTCCSTPCCPTPQNHAYWQIIWLCSIVDYAIWLFTAVYLVMSLKQFAFNLTITSFSPRPTRITVLYPFLVWSTEIISLDGLLALGPQV